MKWWLTVVLVCVFLMTLSDFVTFHVLIGYLCNLFGQISTQIICIF
jgi:hypothetical protein